MQSLKIYKCDICGNIIELIDEGKGTLVCCGQNMTLVEEKKEDTGQEKHLPVVEEIPDGIKVKVGSIPHPMEKEHFIQWIEVITDSRAYREFLSPGSSAEAIFSIKKSEVKKVRELCNLHGLWAKE